MSRVELNPTLWLKHPQLARETYERLTSEGLLLAASRPDGRLNPMTIGWGTFGAIWGRPMFLVLVRPSRFTYSCIEAAQDFTVNVLPHAMQDVADYCGTTSGRAIDKMAEKALTALPSRRVASAGIAQANIIYECKVVHHNDVQQPAFPEEILSNYYPEGDFHRVYFGQILNVSVEPKYFETAK